ncbi:uncharacterized protein A4U43_C03F2690 [Asparagus officinalis]|uniref:Xylanase inhibitor C-terminal domain-containing protein n=1 Tax=Asparagus officinalis TaxID=4686 RepID=A0A5P1F7D0_ASPOF|nr:uncharacterized protein A4U43_C03F2690 [Asparagus officinalis]
MASSSSAISLLLLSCPSHFSPVSWPPAPPCVLPSKKTDILANDVTRYKMPVPPSSPARLSRPRRPITPGSTDRHQNVSILLTAPYDWTTRRMGGLRQTPIRLGNAASYRPAAATQSCDARPDEPDVRQPAAQRHGLPGARNRVARCDSVAAVEFRLPANVRDLPAFASTGFRRRHFFGTYVGGERSVEHFIGLKAIKVNEEVVKLNTSLLAIDKNGVGGTKISTVAPFTVLETSIYKAVTDAFDAVHAVPAIDLVLQSESVYWRIFGGNSMVEAEPGVLCLGFVDGGVNPRTSIVVGGHQIEDNLLQFDLSNGRLGFSSSLLFHQTTCGNFNFTASTMMGGSENYGLIKEM